MLLVAELCVFCMDRDGLPKVALVDGLLFSLPVPQTQSHYFPYQKLQYINFSFKYFVSVYKSMTAYDCVCVCVCVCVCMQIKSFSVSLCWQFLFCPLLKSLDSFWAITIYRIYILHFLKQRKSFNHAKILKLVNPFTGTAMMSLESDPKKGEI